MSNAVNAGVEPWLSGSLAGLHPVIAGVLYSFEQARHDLAKWTEGLTAEQIWARPGGIGPVGFHLRHIAGSVDRLFTYAEGRQLGDEQMKAMRAEMEPGAGRDEMLAAIEATFRRVEEKLRRIDPVTLTEARAVGRKGLPTTLAGLLVHIAEHTQRHVGEAIVTAKVVRRGS